MDVKVFGRGTAGNVFPIVVRTRRKTPNSRDMPYENVVGLGISATGPTGAAVSMTGSFVYVQDGVYVYNWNTAGLSAGTYNIVVTVRTDLSDSTGSVQTGIVRLY